MSVDTLRRVLLFGLSALPLTACVVHERVERPRPVYVRPVPPPPPPGPRVIIRP